MTVDAAGNIIAAGSISQPCGGCGQPVTEDIVVVKMSATDGGELWRAVLGGGGGFSNADRAHAVAVDGNGDVVAGGYAGNGSFSGALSVVKLSGTDGTQLWSRSLRGTWANAEGPVPNEARAIAIDANGDVLVGGSVLNSPGGRDFAVIKLSGTDGSELWRVAHSAAPASAALGESARTIAADGNGDVIAIGNLAMRISGPDGAVLWRVDLGLDGTGTVDANGDLVVFEGGPGVESAVVKRSGVDGAELWRVATDPPLISVSSMITDAQGNVVVAGRLEGSFPITLKLAGTTGAELWRGVSETSDAGINKLAHDGNGDVIAAGRVGTQFTIIKLAGSNGAFLWSQDSATGSALSVAVDAQGDVIAGGSTNGAFTVTKLRGADGSDFVGSAEFSASPTTTTAGGLITGTWSGITTPTPTDWIGLYAVQAGHEEYLDWKYVGCEQTPTSGFASGSCQFVVPNWLGPGTYQFRLFGANSFTLLATSDSFSVVPEP